jgi:predicted Zn-dependent protease
VKQAFFDLTTALNAELHAGEVLLANFAGERSDFVRFNHGKVRQAGTVEQRVVSLRLVQHQRQAGATVTLTGMPDDVTRARGALSRLRDVLAQLPEDPWLRYSESPQPTTAERRGALEPPEAVVSAVVRAANGHDLVGFYGGGALFRGFANSLGQHNWHEVDSFSMDWSLYHAASIFISNACCAHSKPA